MKKFLGYSVTMAMALSVNFVVPTAAQAEKGLPGRPVCKFLFESQTPIAPALEPFKNVGECVSFTNQLNGKHAICHILEQTTVGLGGFGFKNFGDCVSNVN